MYYTPQYVLVHGIGCLKNKSLIFPISRMTNDKYLEEIL